MLPVPEQRRPSLTRRRKRYTTVSELSLAICVEQIVGWEIARVVRLPDGSLDALYVR
jgi:hypothetical protein